MRSDVHRDMTASSRVFVDIVWPAITDIVGGGRLKPVEGNAEKGLEQDLDMLAGIDGFQMLDKQGVMRSIATRVQWIPPQRSAYRTFTIRKSRPNGAKTEREKRLDAIEHRDLGCLYPHLTIQAYVRKSTEELLSVGIIRTIDLFACVRDHPSNDTNKAGNGGEGFEIYHFDYLRDYGYDVCEWGLPQYQQSLTLDGREAA